jgi:hypothetical protein
VSPRLIAQGLAAAVNSDSPATIKWRQKFGASPDLGSIRPGAAHATRYHRTIFKALQGIFDGELTNGQIEQEINTGIHRVDIMFDNSAEAGFFAEIRNRFKLQSNYVPAECKNYAADLGSPEYDQLSGRLNDDIGRVGLLVFREIADAKKALAHQQAKWKKGDVLILLDDSDVLRMHKARHDGRPDVVDDILRQKVRQLKLNTVK